MRLIKKKKRLPCWGLAVKLNKSVWVEESCKEVTMLGHGGNVK